MPQSGSRTSFSNLLEADIQNCNESIKRDFIGR